MEKKGSSICKLHKGLYRLASYRPPLCTSTSHTNFPFPRRIIRLPDNAMAIEAERSNEKSDVIFDEKVDSTQPVGVSEYSAVESITWKTWIVIFILSSCFGLSFWPVPTTAAMQARLAPLLGDTAGTSSYWYIPAYTTGSSLGFLIAGANSDLFGRRLFL